MRKKFLSAFMLGALTLAATSTFVSCKDYDGDISALKSDVSALKADLETKYQKVVSDLAAQKAELETKIAAEKNLLQAAIDNNKALIDANKKLIDANVLAIAQNKADIAANAGKIADLEASVTKLQTALAAVDARLTTAEADIVILKADKADKAEVAKAVEDLKALIATEKAALEAAIAKKADQSYVEAVEARVKALEDKLPLVEDATKANAAAIGVVAADLAALTGDVNGLKADLKTLAEKVAANEADLKDTMEKLAAEILARQKGDEALGEFLSDMIFDVKGDLSDEVTARIAAVADLQKQIDALVLADVAINERIDDVKADLDFTYQGVIKNADDITSLRNELTAYYEELMEGLTQSQSDIIGIIDQLRGIKGDISNLTDELDKAFEGIIANGVAINANQSDIATLQALAEDIQNDVAANRDQLVRHADLISNLQGDMATAQESIETLVADVNQAFQDIIAVRGDINGLRNDIANLDEKIQGQLSDINKEIGLVSGRVNVLEVLVTKRLTAINFAPTAYVDGIEAIEFNNIMYKDWNGAKGSDQAANWMNDAWESNEVVIDKDKTTAVYHVSPSHVKEDAIKALSFISQVATNSRAEESPIKVESYKFDQEAGHLVVTLAKNNTKSLNISRDKFNIVSLKAAVNPEYITEAEKKAGINEINVYSDWARLVENTVRPYIRNAKAEDFTDFGHFFSYSEIYSKGKGASALEAVYYTNERAEIIKNAIKVKYNESKDLKPYVSACVNKTNGGHKNFDDYAKYGLSIEFKLMSCYNVKNEGSTGDATNQCKYAKLEDGVLTPQTANGLTDNRDAMGKTPVVQVIMRDKKNNAVVDVRYILVNIIERDIKAETLNVYDAKPTPFDCGETYNVTIGEEYMNYLAALVNLESAAEFAKVYTIDDVLYATDKLEKNKVYGDVHVLKNGTVTGQADNVVVQFWGDKVGKLTDELCETGKTSYTGYIKIFNALGMHVYTVPVKLNLTFDKASAINKKYTKINNYWKNYTDLSAVEPDMYVVANPTHEKTGKYAIAQGYSDTQLLYEILNAYTDAEGNSPQKPEDLVINLNAHDGDYAQIEFDEARIQEMMESKLWNVSEDGLTLYKGQEIAATLTKTGKIQLYENVGNAPSGIKGIPSEAAKEFVAYLNDPEKNGIAVQLVAYQCTHRDVLDQFVVRFEKPLKYTALKDNVTLVDQLSQGSTKTFNLHDIFCLQECFGSMNRIVWGPAHVTDFGTLVSWYRVKTIVDVENAKLNGKLLKDYKNQDGSDKYTLIYHEQTLLTPSSFTFINNSGNAITEDLDIQVEMQVTSKWRTWDPITFHVNVQQTTTTAK